MRKSRVRKSAEETRDLMVAAGLHQLQLEGIGLGLDRITLEAACVAADIPRSSSHSAWAIDDTYSPQVTYQRAVVRAWLLEREDSLFADAAQKALVDLFADPADPPSASAIVRTSIQSAFEAGFGIGDPDKASEGDYLSTDLALRYAIASRPDDGTDDEIADWLQQGETSNRRDRIEDSYKPLGTLLGMQPKEAFGELGYELFGIVVASLVEGIGLRNRILPDLNLGQTRYSIGAGEHPATILEMCVEAMVPIFFEPIPAGG